MCRAYFDKAFVPQIDKELVKEIKKNAGDEFEQRKAELVEEGQWFGENVTLIKLVFGNQYEAVENPKLNRSKDRLMAHRWAMFMTLNNDKELTERFISRVDY